MIKVGCCGFPTSIKKYCEVFNLVELNSTFYSYPRPETAMGWFKKAPQNFEFTVKAHQDITHKAKMRVTVESLQAFNRIKEICKALKAHVLLFQTPASFRPDRLDDAEEFFKCVESSLDDLVLVWETRGSAWEKADILKRLNETLERLGVVHATDPFRVLPAFVSDVAYFRLHGLGEQMYYYQYSDSELRRLLSLVKQYDGQNKCIYVLFNNLAMFDDALRFLHFLKRGKFPRLAAAIGLNAAREIFAKARFPAAKEVLVKRFGWRLIELREGEQARLNELLMDLPSKNFNGLNDLLKEIEAKIESRFSS